MERFKIEYKRGHGPGGQHKNKVESCVVVTDELTGFKETCQEFRSQHKNKRVAILRVEKRIAEYEELKRKELQNKQRLMLIDGCMRIRTYNFARNEVVDHRTGKKAPLRNVLNGRPDLLH